MSHGAAGYLSACAFKDFGMFPLWLTFLLNCWLATFIKRFGAIFQQRSAVVPWLENKSFFPFLDRFTKQYYFGQPAILRFKSKPNDSMVFF